MRIAIYGSRRQHEYAGTIALFLDTLRTAGIETVMHRKLYSHLQEIMPEFDGTGIRVADGPDFGADLAVSLGGDGTFLRTAMWVAEKQIPIVGVNTGHLGFLTALTIDELPGLLDLIKSDGLRCERRALLRLDCEGVALHTWPYALNEITVAKEETSSMISALVEVDGAPLATYRADGLLVCTATGSTAYNLSLGGPIVAPGVGVSIINPIAAHSLSMRPLVVGAASRITVTPQARAQHVRLSLDSRSMSVPAGTRLEISRAPFTVCLMQRADRTFASTLRDKLRWGGDN